MKTINWSNRTVHNQLEHQFESSPIIRWFITMENSGQFNLFLQLGLIISSSSFSFYDFLSFHHPQQRTNPAFDSSSLMQILQLLQVFQSLCFILLITFLALAAAVSDMVGFSLLIQTLFFEFWSLGRFKSAFDMIASQALVQSQFQQKKSTNQCACLRHLQYSKIWIIMTKIKKN